jgi:hypothetical protein
MFLAGIEKLTAQIDKNRYETTSTRQLPFPKSQKHAAEIFGSFLPIPNAGPS